MRKPLFEIDGLPNKRLYLDLVWYFCKFSIRNVL